MPSPLVGNFFDTLFEMGVALKKDSGQAEMTSLKLFAE
jgi:hypothetical protein